MSTHKDNRKPEPPPSTPADGSGDSDARLRVALNDIELIATPGRTPPYMQGKGLGAKLDEICRIAHRALVTNQLSDRRSADSDYRIH